MFSRKPVIFLVPNFETSVFVKTSQNTCMYTYLYNTLLYLQSFVAKRSHFPWIEWGPHCERGVKVGGDSQSSSFGIRTVGGYTRMFLVLDCVCLHKTIIIADVWCLTWLSRLLFDDYNVIPSNTNYEKIFENDLILAALSIGLTGGWCDRSELRGNFHHTKTDEG